MARWAAAVYLGAPDSNWGGSVRRRRGRGGATPDQVSAAVRAELDRTKLST